EAPAPSENQAGPRQQRADRQAVHSVAMHDPVDDHHEGSRRTADLDAAAPEEGDQEPGNGGGDEPSVRGDAGSDREGERQRDRNDADDESRLEVREKLPL